MERPGRLSASRPFPRLADRFRRPSGEAAPGAAPAAAGRRALKERALPFAISAPDTARRLRRKNRLALAGAKEAA